MPCDKYKYAKKVRDEQKQKKMQKQGYSFTTSNNTQNLEHGDLMLPPINDRGSYPASKSPRQKTGEIRGAAQSPNYPTQNDFSSKQHRKTQSIIHDSERSPLANIETNTNENATTDIPSSNQNSEQPLQEQKPKVDFELKNLERLEAMKNKKLQEQREMEEQREKARRK